MKRYFAPLFLLLMSFFTATFGEILKDASGNRFITLGSTMDDVIEVLGTPSEISGSHWYYKDEYITFNLFSERVNGYSNAKALKVLLIPKSKK